MLPLLKAAAIAARPDTDKKRRAYVGCVAVRTDGTIVRSRNGSATSVCPQLHAEARVSRKASFGSTYYVARVLKNGNMAMAKPCKRCMALLKSRGAAYVAYTVGEEEWKMVVP